MKKTIIIVSVLLIAILAVTLTGCSNTPAHKKLLDTWSDYELITYDVSRTLVDGTEESEKGRVIKGEHTILTERINRASVTVGEKTIDNFTGTAITIKTTFEDGGYQNSKLIFDTSMRPTAMYKEIFVKGYSNNFPATDLTEKINAEYIDKECRYTKDTNGEKIENVIKLKDKWVKRPFFDIMQVYHLARASFTGKNAAFTAIASDVPSFEKGELRQINVSAVKAEEIKINEVTYKTTLVAIQFKKEFPGAGLPVYAWYNSDSMEAFGKNVLLKIQEGNITYSFKSISAKV